MYYVSNILKQYWEYLCGIFASLKKRIASSLINAFQSSAYSNQIKIGLVGFLKCKKLCFNKTYYMCVSEEALEHGSELLDLTQTCNPSVLSKSNFTPFMP